MRLVIAECQVDYAGKLTAHLPLSQRLILIKADGSVSIHADDRAYKPLNWMSPPCTITETEPLDSDPAGTQQVWQVQGKDDAALRIAITSINHDSQHELGIDPGLTKDGVEAHLQALLAENPSSLGTGFTVVQREFPTPIGPVDLLCKDADGKYVLVEVKRRGEIDGVEQLTRYLDMIDRDTRYSPVRGVFAAQQIRPQAKTLAKDRGIDCVTVDYDALRGIDDADSRLF